jgi:DNA-binding MarR family transcriptional regulator
MQDRGPDIVVPDDIQRAWIALQRVGPALRERVDETLAAAGLPALSIYSVLWTIYRAAEPIRPKDLGLLLFLPRYQISRQIDRLVEDGLVLKEECPEDARGFLVSLTPEGKRLRLAMWGVYGPAMRDAMGPLTEAEARTITELLNRLA